MLYSLQLDHVDLLANKAQLELTERLMQHKEKVGHKNKLSQIQQEFIQSKEAEPKEEFKKQPTVHLSGDYKMYNHQMECEVRRKARMYNMAIAERKKESEAMAQIKP